MRVQVGEGQPLAVGDDRLDLAVEHAEGVEQSRQGRRQVGDDRPSRLVAAELDAAAFAGHLLQDRVIFAVELARHAVSSTLPFIRPSL